MDSPERRLLRLMVDRDPASLEFRNEAHAILAELYPTHRSEPCPAELQGAHFDLSDVFVHQPLAWGRFLQSALLHGVALALIWTISLSWIRQQKMLDNARFDRSSLVTYTPEEYLPPLDTGPPEAPKEQVGDPAYAKQPVLSVPPEADNRTQTIVAPPDLKLKHDVALPNIIATGAIAPAVPLDATQMPSMRMVAPETQVVAPAPEVQVAEDRVVRSAMKSDVIAPPPEVAPLATRVKAHVPGESIEPVAPPPSVATSGGGPAAGRLIALGINPVAPSGPIIVPPGNRRGTFGATPHGKPGASGTPDLTGRGREDGGSKTHNGSFPAGLHVGAADSSAREVARLVSADAGDSSIVPSEKATELDRQVFGDKLFHTMALNMPNLNSSTGSWVIHFAELEGGHKEGELTAPRSTEKLDPGYPLELIRANVHGMVSLYAVIDANGKVTSVRVLNSPDERLDSYATKALSMCKFQPAERAGKPVPLEALVMIPFRVKRSF
jgi:TonB family protein